MISMKKASQKVRTDEILTAICNLNWCYSFALMLQLSEARNAYIGIVSVTVLLRAHTDHAH